jgi:hypothetical protein
MIKPGRERGQGTRNNKDGEINVLSFGPSVSPPQPNSTFCLKKKLG